MSKRLLLGGVLAGVFMLAGCGDGVSMMDVKGTVNFAGSPLPYGEIEFIPNTTLENSGPAGTAEIVDGKFDTSNGGQGVVPGSQKIRITGYEARPVANEDETKTVEQKPPLFVAYLIEMDVDGSDIVLDVPAEAKGFNSYAEPKKARNDP